MRRFLIIACTILLVAPMIAMSLAGCDQEDRDKQMVNDQQTHLRNVHPLPYFDYSRELEIYKQIYQARNLQIATYAVWRSDYGLIEGDCPCLGFPIPYDVQMTNPVRRDYNSAVIEQAEPNGLFSSKNTAATWVPCLNENGEISPVYVESKVTSYPYAVEVDYNKNRVTRVKGAKPSVSIKVDVSSLKKAVDVMPAAK